MKRILLPAFAFSAVVVLTSAALAQAQAQSVDEIPFTDDKSVATGSEAPAGTPAASAVTQTPPVPPAPPIPPVAPVRTGWLNNPDAFYQMSLHAELGLLWPVSHTIQFGKQGTRIDYVAQGGQDNLFPFMRMSAEVELFKHHEIALLYQPLQLVTTQTARDEIRVFDTRYAAGTPMRFTYGFDFWRLSYLYDFNDSPETELAVGASLQIRNATIVTEAVDGSQANYTRNIGPVPVLKGRFRTDLGHGFWVGAEADGFYAPIRYLNGGTVDVEGAILDASLRGGMHLTPGVDTFLNLRDLGGGARGTNSNTREPGDGFSNNWLHFVSLTLGFTLR